MRQAAPYVVVFSPAARRSLDKLPLAAAVALYEHLTGPVAENPYRLGKPLDVPFDELRSARRGDYRALYTVDQRRERSARTALTELETEYAARRRELERELEEAETAASTVREGLLYGTGKQLADTARSVLEWAGVTVADLDDQLGGTNLIAHHVDRLTSKKLGAVVARPGAGK